jgi:acetoin utilization deacetylase AcuC-like enzyme
MQVIHSPLQAGHDVPSEVAMGRPIPPYEVSARVDSILVALTEDERFSVREPDGFGTEPIVAVHEPRMLRYLERAWKEWRQAGMAIEAIVPDTILMPGLREGMGTGPEPESPGGRVGYWCFDTMTAIVEGTYPAARAAVEVALTTARLVVEGEPLAYGLCRPPGHHAARAMFGGYCYLNNAAIAAEWLVRRTGQAVAILDLDVHHGNGTQQIFYEREDVLYISLHADPATTFPYFAGYATETGSGRGRGTTLNLPLPRGTGDEPYGVALEQALDRIDGFAPGPIVVSLGLDTYEEDPIGPLRLTAGAYRPIAARVAALGRPLVVLQEGGYHVPTLGRNVRSWLLGAAGVPDEPERGTARAD